MQHHQCPRCGAGFVAREPFVRVEALVRVSGDSGRAVFASTTSGLFHLRCAPWGDPKYRITQPGA